MAKAYAVIKPKSKYFKAIKKWKENKIHHDQMFYEFLKEIKEQCLGVKLTDKYIYMENPRDLTLVKNHPHVKQEENGLYRFNRFSKLWRQWTEYKELNYIDDIEPLENLENILGVDPVKIVYYLTDYKILADITPREGNYRTDLFIEQAQDRISSDEVEFIRASEFLRHAVGVKDKYEYTGDD